MNIGAIQSYPLGPLAYFMAPTCQNYGTPTAFGGAPGFGMDFRTHANALQGGWDCAFPMRPARNIKPNVAFGIELRFAPGIGLNALAGQIYYIRHAFAGQDSKLVSTVG